MTDIRAERTRPAYRIILWLCAVLLATTALGETGLEDVRQLTRVRLGEIAPDILLPGTGERLSTACKQQIVALVFLPPDARAAAEVTQSVTDMRSRGRFAGGMSAMIDPSSEDVRRGYLWKAANGVIVFLIDQSRALRRVSYIPAAASDSAGRRLLEMFESFQRGKLVYESACARCHGADGKHDEYAHIKTLGGIGNRLTPRELTERVRPVPLGSETFSVRTSVLSRKDLDSLVLYVAGL